MQSGDMTSNRYQLELGVAVDLAREAGALILNFYEGPLDIEQKTSSDDSEPVTQADTLANELIVSRLARDFPGDGILAEESIDTERRLDKSRVWMVDPLDGTSGFIAGNGDFAVQIGLVEDGVCVVGVVYLPLKNILYRAVLDQGTYIESTDGTEERAHVSDQKIVSKMRLAASRSHRSPRMNTVVTRLGFKDEIRRGSVGIKIGMIIERKCDVYIHLSPRTKQWDTCAPQLILTEAGGRLTDLFGAPLSYNVRELQNRNGLVASNGVAHDEIIDMMAPLLDEFGRYPV